MYAKGVTQVFHLMLSIQQSQYSGQLGVSALLLHCSALLLLTAEKLLWTRLRTALRGEDCWPSCTELKGDVLRWLSTHHSVLEQLVGKVLFCN